MAYFPSATADAQAFAHDLTDISLNHPPTSATVIQFPASATFAQRAPAYGGDAPKPPSWEELETAKEQREYFAELAALNTDAALIEGFGPNAVDPVEISYINLNAKHAPPMPCRMGDVYMALASPLANVAKKQLPLVCPVRLESGHARVARTADNVQAIHFVCLDYDRGDAPVAEVSARAMELGLHGGAYRTPSDGTDITEILRCKGTPDNPVGEIRCEPTVEACKAWMLAKGYRADVIGDLTIVNPAKIERETHRIKRGDGSWRTVDVVRTKIVVRHNRLAKTRLVIGLRKPFVRRANESAADFTKRWNDDVLDPIARVLGYYPDESCSDPSRAFYIPAANPPSGADDIFYVIPGPAFDLDGENMKAWRAAAVVPREKAREERKARVVARRVERERVTGTPSGRYRLADAIRALASDYIRRDRSEGLVVCECPFDHLHSNTGDPSDSAFWASNGGNCGCHHTHGAEHEPDDYVAQMIADGWFTQDQLDAHKRTNAFDVFAKYLKNANKNGDAS